ncbi:leucine-rich repeat protein [Treponema sp. R80B11-R83G3]
MAAITGVKEGIATITVIIDGKTASATITVTPASTGGGGGTTVTVTFNINNGTGTVPNPQSGTSGSTITLPGGNGFSREGYIFLGWNTQADGNGTTYTTSMPTPNSNITLYAKWVASTFTGNSIDGFKEWLTSMPENTVQTPYTVKLNINDLGTYTLTGGNSKIISGVGGVLWQNPYSKYVNLDLTDCDLTIIVNSAFYTCGTLVGITLPNNVTTIEESAFYMCSKLTSVTIGNDVAIDDKAFSNCTSLASVTIGNNVTIGKWAFSYCTSLTSVAIPGSVTTIGKYAFYSCTGLTNITITNGVTTIGEEAFSGCTDLTSVTIPDSVTTIGEEAFYNCTSLTSVTFGRNDTTIGAWAFPGDTSGSEALKTAYNIGKDGTYTRSSTSSNDWAKQ